MQMGFGPGRSHLCTYLLCMTLKKKKVFSQSRAYTSFPRCFSSTVCGLPSASQPRWVSHGSLWKRNAEPPPQIVSFSHLHRVVWYNQIHSEWAWGECVQRQPFINWLLLKKKKSFGASLVGIPFAQPVQEASGVTQRRRASLELLQKSKCKTNHTYPCYRLHASPKNPPPHTEKLQNASLRNQ